MLGAADHVEHAGPRAADITFAGLLEVRVEEQHVVVVRTLAQGLDVFLCFCEIRFQVSHGVLSSFSERVGLEHNAAADATTMTMLQDRKERRVGKACVSTCRSRWSPYH